MAGQAGNQPSPVPQGLLRDTRVLDAYPVYRPGVVKHSLPNDPLLPVQWHLYNVGQTNGATNGGVVESNVEAAWDTGMTGKGALISVVDDGIEYTHPDLNDHIVQSASYDFLSGDDDPMPTATTDGHGTSVAGVAAAVGNNGIGGSGVAPDALLGASRLIAGSSITDTELTDALNWNTTKGAANGLGGFEPSQIDIYNNSWGFVGPGILRALFQSTSSAVSNSAANGRGGLGSIYVFSAGNDRANQDNTNYSGLTNNRYFTTVAAVGDDGQVAEYSTPGANVLISAPSNGGFSSITTTDRVGSAASTVGYSTTDYTDTFGGTSSAAPFVSGVIAQMLQANPNLSWRDVQHILARSATRVDPASTGWDANPALPGAQPNGGGRWVSDDYGFGLINAAGAVNLASNWRPVGPELVFDSQQQTVNAAIPDNTGVPATGTFNVAPNIRVEHVEVAFTATHPDRGQLEVTLTSPSGTQSVLAATRHQRRQRQLLGLDVRHGPGLGRGVGRQLDALGQGQRHRAAWHRPDVHQLAAAGLRHRDHLRHPRPAGGRDHQPERQRDGQRRVDPGRSASSSTSRSTPSPSPPTTSPSSGWAAPPPPCPRSCRSTVPPPATPPSTSPWRSPVSTVGNYRVDIGPNIADPAGHPDEPGRRPDQRGGDPGQVHRVRHPGGPVPVLPGRQPGSWSIPSGGSFTAGVDLPAVNTTDINVWAWALHDFAGDDLKMELQAPGDVFREVARDATPPGSRINGNGFRNTVLDDEAPTTFGVTDNYQYTGSYKPTTTPLSTFEGPKAAGTWNLRFSNASGAGAGEWYSGLILTPAGVPNVTVNSVTNTDADRDKVEVAYTIANAAPASLDLGVYGSTDPFWNVNSDTPTGTLTITDPSLLTVGAAHGQAERQPVPGPELRRQPGALQPGGRRPPAQPPGAGEVRQLRHPGGGDPDPGRHPVRGRQAVRGQQHQVLCQHGGHRLQRDAGQL